VNDARNVRRPVKANQTMTCKHRTGPGLGQGKRHPPI
jgi:hypothetical protein